MGDLMSIIISFGYMIMSIGVVLLYLTVWLGLFKAIREKVDDGEDTNAAVLSALLILYTGTGIAALGFAIY